MSTSPMKNSRTSSRDMEMSRTFFHAGTQNSTSQRPFVLFCLVLFVIVYWYFLNQR